MWIEWLEWAPLLEVAAVVLCAIFGIFVLFWLLQWWSDRTYRPTRAEVRVVLQAAIEGRLDWYALDDFVSVRIAYDPQLDQLRERFNSILDERGCISREMTKSNPNTLTLSEEGLARVRAVISDLDNMQS